MDPQVETFVAAGDAALAAGDWAGARDAYRRALDAGDSAEALLGLGSVWWWLGDQAGAIECLEGAYARFRRRPDPVMAAAAALRLAFHQGQHLGNRSAESGWLARAVRLVEEHDLEPLRGELLFFRALAALDPRECERLAREAHALGKAEGSPELELCALCQLGAALVRQGRLDEGLPMLDEAMAGAVGGEVDLESTAFVGCTTLVASTDCADVQRALDWVAAAQRFVDRYGSPFVHAECRTAYGVLLVWTGDWERAEAELRAAVELAQGGVETFRARAVAALAELALLRGDIAAAERLLAGVEGQPATAVAQARVHLASGRTEEAAAVARRRLAAVDGDRLEGSALVEVLGEAEIAAGDRAGAAARGRGMAATAAELGCRLARARGERLAGRALVEDDPEAAAAHLDRAMAEYVRLGMAPDTACTRRLLAEALAPHEPALARAEARAALGALERLGAAREADAAAALLRRLGAPAPRSGAGGDGGLTAREGEVLALLGEGLSNPEIAARLHLSRKTVEHHVAHVLAKLGARSRAEAAAEAVRRSRATG